MIEAQEIISTAVREGQARPVSGAKGILAEGGFATAVLVAGNNISSTVAYAESYLIPKPVRVVLYYGG